MEKRRILTKEETAELEELLDLQEKAIVGLANLGEYMIKSKWNITMKERDAYQVLHEWLFGGNENG